MFEYFNKYFIYFLANLNDLFKTFDWILSIEAAKFIELRSTTKKNAIFFLLDKNSMHKY